EFKFRGLRNCRSVTAEHRGDAEERGARKVTRECADGRRVFVTGREIHQRSVHEFATEGVVKIGCGPRDYDARAPPRKRRLEHAADTLAWREGDDGLRNNVRRGLLRHRLPLATVASDA